jgi:hypothetical protein
MRKFSIWLENKKYEDAKTFVINYLNLDNEKGMSQSLDGFDKKSLLNKIKDTSFYSNISERAREKIDNMLTSKTSKTVGDLVRAASVSDI